MPTASVVTSNRKSPRRVAARRRPPRLSPWPKRPPPQPQRPPPRPPRRLLQRPSLRPWRPLRRRLCRRLPPSPAPRCGHERLRHRSLWPPVRHHPMAPKRFARVSVRLVKPERRRRVPCRLPAPVVARFHHPHVPCRPPAPVVARFRHPRACAVPLVRPVRRGPVPVLADRRVAPVARVVPVPVVRVPQWAHPAPVAQITPHVPAPPPRVALPPLAVVALRLVVLVADLVVRSVRRPVAVAVMSRSSSQRR